MGAGRSQVTSETRGLSPGIHGSSRTIENYSRLSHDRSYRAPAALAAEDGQPEFLFDFVGPGFNLFVESENFHYKLLEPAVGNLFAKRSKCSIWNAIIGLKGSGDVDGVFKQLDEQGCFTNGCEWRGVCGETVFHICFLLMGDTTNGMVSHLGRLAVKIHEKNTWFLNAPYTQGVYEGEVAMHLAIAHTDMGSVKWLLEQKATLEHNAIGQFFHRFNWGECPVAWAACTAKSEILEALLEHKANLNFRDTHNNTVVHNMALAPNIWHPEKFIGVFQVLTRHDPSIVDAFQISNNDGRTPLQVASAFEEGNFNAIMQCTCKIQWVFGPVKCTNHLLRGWDSAHSRQFQEGVEDIIGSEEEEVSALEVALLEGNSQFFCTPLNQLLLRAKWTLFARHEFMNRSLFFFMFVVIATASCCIDRHFKLALLLRLWAFGLASFTLAYHSAAFLRVRRTKFVRGLRSYIMKAFLFDVHKTIACTGVLVAIAIESYLDYEPAGTLLHHTLSSWLYGIVMPFSMLIAWGCTFELLFLHEYLSNVLLVIIEIIKLELPVWVFLQFLLLAAFSSAMYVATEKAREEHENAVFGNYLQTVVAMALVPLGGIPDVDQLMAGNNDFVVCILCFVYSALSCVLFLNLTISLFTERTREIWNNRDRYYYTTVALMCISEEKRRQPQDLRKFWIGTKLGDGKHYLLVQKFVKNDEQEFE